MTSEGQSTEQARQAQDVDARLILYPDSGHGSHFQFSEEFAEEAARFFAAA